MATGKKKPKKRQSSLPLHPRGKPVKVGGYWRSKPTKKGKKKK